MVVSFNKYVTQISELFCDLKASMENSCLACLLPYRDVEKCLSLSHIHVCTLYITVDEVILLE